MADTSRNLFRFNRFDYLGTYRVLRHNRHRVCQNNPAAVILGERNVKQFVGSSFSLLVL